MSKIINTMLTTAALSMCMWPAAAHLGLDHLKQNLDVRYKDVYSSSKLNESYKASALSQLKMLESRYTSAASLSNIPSQKQAAADMCAQLSREIQNFDRMLNEYKSASASKK